MSETTSLENAAAQMCCSARWLRRWVTGEAGPKLASVQGKRGAEVDPHQAYQHICRHAKRIPSGFRAPLSPDLTAPGAAHPSTDPEKIAETSAPAAEVVADDDKLIGVLESGRATPLEIARATVHDAARRYAYARRRGNASGMDLTNIKKALEELRRAEADYQALAVRRGELIDKGAACAVAGYLGHRAVQMLEVMGHRLAVQMELWLADTDFTSVGAEDRRHILRSWWKKETRSARQTESDAITRLIDDELSEDGAP